MRRVACVGLPSIYISEARPGPLDAVAERIRNAIRARQAAAPIGCQARTFASIVKRCEVVPFSTSGVAGGVPPYRVSMIEFDEPPWDRFLDVKPWGRFICPGCGQTLDMTR